MQIIPETQHISIPITKLSNMIKNSGTSINKCSFFKIIFFKKYLNLDQFQRYKKIFILALMILVLTNNPITETRAESPYSKILEIRCIHMYEKFKIMGEENLRKRYPAKTIMNSCISMYKDPSWNFEGKEIIDKKYPTERKNQLNSNILSIIKIGPSKSLVKFQICSEPSQKSKYLLVTTDQEQFLGTILRSTNDICSNFWSIMRVNNPEKIEFSWQYSDMSNSYTIRKLM